MEFDKEKERDFKTNPQHWSVVVNFCELYPNLLTNNFSSRGNDNYKNKQHWEELTQALNSLGYGSKTVDKWQLAIGRWKSKVKSKASSIRKEMVQTGGGTATTGQLTEVEEKLMAIMGWKAVTGDGNIELGLKRKLPLEEDEQENIGEPFPKLVPISSAVVNEIPGPSCKPEKLKKPKENVPKRKVLGDRTRRFVNLSNMHKENQEILKKMDNNIELIAKSLVTVNKNFEIYIKYLMTNDETEKWRDEDHD